MFPKIINDYLPEITSYNSPWWKINSTQGEGLIIEELFNAKPNQNTKLLTDQFGRVGEKFSISAPFYFDYGKRIFIGSDVFLGGGMVILDVGPVNIADNVKIGRNVHIYAVTHDVDPVTRSRDRGIGINIEKGARICDGAIVLGGVTIGRNALVCGGAVVYKDVPANTIYPVIDNKIDYILAKIAADYRLDNTFVATKTNSDKISVLFKYFGDQAYIRSDLYYRVPNNIIIGNKSWFNVSCQLDGVNGIEFGESSLMGPGVKIYTDLEHNFSQGLQELLYYLGRQGVAPAKAGKVVFKENVWIGGGAIIFPGVTIGQNSVIAAGSLVTADVPANTVFAGRPAIYIKRIVSNK